jgi:putative hemolysin
MRALEGADVGTLERAGLLAFRKSRIIRDLHGLLETLARAGGLELKFAITRKEIRALQKMRYRVFFEQGGAVADPRTQAQRRDNCPFDRLCDHIIVVDHEYVTRTGRRKPRIVGAYRVLRHDVAGCPSRFYAANEFHIADLIGRHPDKRFMELGRSCVLPEYRAKRVLELLWRGVLAYVQHHKIDVMFGCASLPGADPHAHQPVIQFLRSHARSDEEWCARSKMSAQTFLPQASPSASARATDRRTLASLPPLIKGYLRLGAMFGDDVFVDHAFGTTDVLVVLPVARIGSRYIEHFGGERELAAA